jgi:hypothetical protein
LLIYLVSNSDVVRVFIFTPILSISLNDRGRLKTGQEEGNADRNGNGAAGRGRDRRRADRISLHAVDQAIYAVVLFMAVATTLIAPPFLVRLFKDERPVDEETLVPLTPIS